MPHQITGILEVYLKRQRDIHPLGQVTLQPSTECTPPCSSRCSRLKRTRECLTVARGQGVYRVYTPCTCELIPVPTYPTVCILYLTIAQILAMVQRPEACSFTHNWAPPRLGCSTFSCNFMLFNLCNMAELSQGLREHPYPGKDCWV